MTCTIPTTLTVKAAVNVILNINGQTATLANSLAVTAFTPVGILSPTSMAMNLKTDIDITITGVNADLRPDINKLSVVLDGTTDYPMKVNEVAYTAVTDSNVITVRYPGANKGSYTVKVTHTEKGILTNDQTFTVGAKITAISPT